MNSKLQKQMQHLEQAKILNDLKASTTRARSITIGTCFGGTTELSMRLEDGTSVWSPMQPVEVIELIHQLAANVGCHIALKPREDFASWRKWRQMTPEENKHLSGWAPFVNDMSPHMEVGAKLSAPEQQPGLQPAMMARSESNEQTVATKKTVGRKRAKRAAASA